MNHAPTDVGTLSWEEFTGGQLNTAERRSLLLPVVRTHATNALGRLSMLARLNSGRRAQVEASRMRVPSSVLTRAAELQATRRLSPALLNHSYRTYAFAAALGALEDLEFDREVLFAAALLHDTGLPTAVPNVDFTLASARIARDVAEDVGLSSAATQTMRTAITLHHSPNVTLAHGAVAYLLSAGAGPDRPSRPDPGPRGHIGWIVAGSLATGLVAALLLVAAPFIPAEESGVTGAVLCGFALGWAMLAVLSVRFTDQPQRWAAAPALFMGLGGLLLVGFGSSVHQVLNWVWPPPCWRW